jgi:hypothetical protein
MSTGCGDGRRASTLMKENNLSKQVGHSRGNSL